MFSSRYRGRFAPTPSGLLHAGSLATALGSWLDARATGGDWLIRIEDLDTPRNQAGADREILKQLELFGMTSDETVIWQSDRIAFYQKALDRLIEKSLAYPCICSRSAIARALQNQGIPRERHQEMIYPGTCRDRDLSNASKNGPSAIWRARIPKNTLILGQDLNSEIGDFVLKRADGVFSYQLAVVLDDQAQKITHIVRGSDLLSNTPRQVWLQQVIGAPTPQYLHLPLVTDPRGEKLSKQTQARAVMPTSTLGTLELLSEAGRHLGLEPSAFAGAKTVADWLAIAVKAWPRMRKTYQTAGLLAE